ncbi:hypothetical protein KEM48_010876, partial [Puccinia striiformis f. sp. tritici PST-130]
MKCSLRTLGALKKIEMKESQVSEVSNSTSISKTQSTAECWNMTSDLNHPKRTTSPLFGSLSKEPRAVGKGDNVTDVITNKGELSHSPVNSNQTNSNLSTNNR